MAPQPRHLVCAGKCNGLSNYREEFPEFVGCMCEIEPRWSCWRSGGHEPRASIRACICASILPRYVDEYVCRYKYRQDDAPLDAFQFLSIFWRSPRRGWLLLSISAEMCPKLDLARPGALDVDSADPLGRIHPAIDHEIQDADIQSG